MKNILSLAVLIATLVSCSNDELVLNKNENVEIMNLYHSIIAEDSDNQFQILKAFDENTQAALWKLKIENFKANQRLSNLQLEKLDNLYEFLSKNNFNDIESKQSLEMKYVIIKSELEDVLEGDDQILFFNKFENFNQFVSKLNETNSSIRKSLTAEDLGQPNYSLISNSCQCDQAMEGLGCSSWVIFSTTDHLGRTTETIRLVAGKCSPATCVRSNSMFLGKLNGKCTY